MAAILLAFVVLAIGYALATPAWNNPDEPAHYNYLRDLAGGGSLPELRPGDWNPQRLDYLKTYQFPSSESVDAIRYESHQPPLYYLLVAPILRMALPFGQQASVLALRAASILLGALLVLVTYRVAQRVILPTAPGRSASRARAVAHPGAVEAAHRELVEAAHPEPVAGSPHATQTSIPLLAAGLAAFVPMHTAMSAAITNDALANLLAGLLLFVLLRALNQGVGTRGALAIGALAGALVLTKLTTYTLVVLALVVVTLIQLHVPGGPAKPGAWLGAARALGLVVLASVLAAAWWVVRQGMVYGWSDLLAQQRHELVVVGQPRWSDLTVEPLSYFATTLFHSFWAQFGWMAILADERLYRLFGLFTVLALIGLCLRLVGRSTPFRFSHGTERPFPAVAAPALLVLAFACLLVFAEVVYYNQTFVQPQGRYLFPALAALATLLAVGWESLLASGRPGRALAAAWLVAAALDGGGMLLGLQLPVRAVYGPALIAAAVVTSLPSSLPAWAALRPAFSLGPVLLLALLDLVSLVRVVIPAFAS